MRVNKKVATGVAAAAGVLALGAGIGVAGLAQAQPTPTPGAPSASPSAGQPGQPGTPDGRGGPGRDGRGHGPGGFLGGPEFAKQLAEKLGVDEAKVTEALQAVRDERRAARPTDPSASPSADPSAKPTPPDRSAQRAELVKALAEKLGVDEAKITAALDEIEAARNAERAAALKERLDAAVKAGTLTQAEADAVTKAVEKGVIGGGPR